MTNKGQAVTNPRISAGATNVNGPRLSWGSGLRLDFHSRLEGGGGFSLDLNQPYQLCALPRDIKTSFLRRASAEALG